MTDSVKEQVGDLVTRAKRRVGVEQPSAADDDGRVGIVRGALRTFGEGDTDGFLDALREDVVWEAPDGGHFPGGGEQLGRDAVKTEFVENAGRTFTDFGFIPESFVEADDVDAVLVIGRFEGDGVEGDRLDEPGVQVWEFQGNAVSRVRIFTDSAGFPAVITERREKELDEKERKEKEKAEKEKDEAKSDDDTKASADKEDDAGKSDDDEDSGDSKDDEQRRNGSDG
ncbi:MAG: SnoaL-like domain [Thermoleophilaceae bacterium]|jgi:ketosteroid isomerase-like protein|nr:SnoaL-like domain [Thermoleophilaceae bacterium]